MADLYNVCVVGCGDIFDKSHADHWQANPHSRIYSVVDTDADVARSAAERVGAEVVSADYEAAFADPAVDLIDIALPHQLHRAATEAACAAGKPILCEKPMAMTVADGQAMVDAAEAAGVPLAIRHTARYEPVNEAMKAQLEAGAVGAPLFASVRTGGRITSERLASLPYWHWFKRRDAGGGAIAGVGVHGVDVMLWLLDGHVRAAYGVGGANVLRRDFADDPQVDVEDTASIIVALEGGVVLHVDASWTLSGPRPPAEVQGTEGAMWASSDGLWVQRLGAEPEQVPVPEVTRTITDDFVDHVRTGSPLPAPAAEVLESVKVLEACYRTIDALL